MLESLGPELLALIFEYVNDASPKNLAAVARTSKYMNFVAKLVLGRHLTFDITGSEALQRLSHNTFTVWSNDDAVLGNIRTITVQGREISPGFTSDPDNKDFDPWSAFTSLIAKAGRLRCLTWNISHRIPASIVRRLGAHQKSASLRVLNYLPTSSAEPTEEVKALCESNNLTHLRAMIRGMVQRPDMREVHVRAIIAEAANLEYAGCTRRSAAEFDQSGFYVSPTSQQSIPSRPNSSVRTLALDGYNISKKVLDDWSAYVDVSRLENLKMTRGFPDVSYFKHAATTLSNLQHISLNFRLLDHRNDSHRLPLKAAAHDYLTECKPVESLSLWSWMSVVTLDELLDQHGATLTNLQLHEREELGDPRPIIGAEGLRKIIEKCPLLTDLTFDINPSTRASSLAKDQDTLEQLEILRQVSDRITRVQMYFDALQAQMLTPLELSDDEEEERYVTLGSSNESREGTSVFRLALTDDTVMKKFVKEVWTRIFGKQRIGRRLLEVKVGEWEAAQGNKDLHPWQLENVRQLIVNPAERDDKPGKCTVRILTP